MVAEAFLGPCPKGEEVRHGDGDRTNPRLDNLSYGTRAQNIADCKIHGTFKNGSPALTETIVREIAAQRDEPAKELAKIYGVSVGAIMNIRLGRTWRHLNLPIQRKTSPKKRKESAPKISKTTIEAILAEKPPTKEQIAQKYGVTPRKVQAVWNGRCVFREPSAKKIKVLDDQTILNIFNSQGESFRAIGQKFGVTAQTVANIKHGRSWNYVTGLQTNGSLPSG
jgi:transcriptional regulator with XRE-family HTH domain